MEILSSIFMPFEWALKFLYEYTGSYAWAILIFTVLLNALLYPLSVKQQKSTAKQAKLKPKLDALKEKCGKDRMKYNNEMQALYQREGVSMTGGCLPMLIRFPILIAVYSIVNKLITEIRGPEGKITDAAVVKAFNLFGINLAETPKLNTGPKWIWIKSISIPLWMRLLVHHKPRMWKSWPPCAKSWLYLWIKLWTLWKPCFLICFF